MQNAGLDSFQDATFGGHNFGMFFPRFQLLLRCLDVISSTQKHPWGPFGALRRCVEASAVPQEVSGWFFERPNGAPRGSWRLLECLPGFHGRYQELPFEPMFENVAPTAGGE